MLDIQNRITLTTAPADHDIGTGIRSAFRRNSRLDASGLSVETVVGGTVILAGTVKSWAEHDEAIAAVWSAPGVTAVDDLIVVEYRARTAG